MKLFLVAFSTLSFLAFAADQDKFSERKKIMLEGMTEQIAALQTNKACIEAAADPAAMKKCHETAKAERTARESKRIDDNIKKLEEKKKALQEKDHE